MKINQQQLNTIPLAIVRILLSIVLTAVYLTGNSCSAQTFDVATDFSATNNPNGVWSYGWSENLTSPLNLYNEHKKVLTDLDLWDTENSLWNNPNVIYNGTPSVITDIGNHITWQPGQLSLHPGFEGVYSHARWTAPIAGMIDIVATFVGLDEDGTTVDVHVLHNNDSLFESWIHSYAAPESFSGTIIVGSGDIIDFAVGYGDNYNLLDDTTGLSATIITVPEPATLLLLGLGAVLARRKPRNTTGL
jgi:hypothetical protein